MSLTHTPRMNGSVMPCAPKGWARLQAGRMMPSLPVSLGPRLPAFQSLPEVAGLQPQGLCPGPRLQSAGLCAPSQLLATGLCGLAAPGSPLPVPKAGHRRQFMERPGKGAPREGDGPWPQNRALWRASSNKPQKGISSDPQLISLPRPAPEVQRVTPAAVRHLHS